MATTRWLAGEGSWEAPSLQGRAVRGDQTSRGGKLGANRLAGEQLDINQHLSFVDMFVIAIQTGVR